MDLLWSLSHTIFSSLSYLWKVIDAISPFLVLIAAVAAVIAAIWSFRLSRRILYYQLLARYSSSEMGKALGIMEELSRLRDIDPKNTAFFKILQEYRVCREGQNPIHARIDSHVKKANGQFIIFCYEYQEINQARRQVSHFFQTIFEMFSKAKALNKTCFKILCAYGSFKFLYYVVEWLERAHATSWEFDPDDIFTKLLEQSGRDDIAYLESRRPPPTWPEIVHMMKSKKNDRFLRF